MRGCVARIFTPTGCRLEIAVAAQRLDLARAVGRTAVRSGGGRRQPSYFLVAVCPIELPHLALERLAGCISRKFRHDDDAVDSLITRRNAGVDPVSQLF